MWFTAEPGRLYVLAALLPLASFVILMIAGAALHLSRQSGGVLHRLAGGGSFGPAYLATAAVALSFVISGYGFVTLPDGHAGGDGDDVWAESVSWAKVGIQTGQTTTGTDLRLGYRVDRLTAVMFVMVTLVATLIHVFAIGYMRDESAARVRDHHYVGHADTEETIADHREEVARRGEPHPPRRGRIGRFYAYFSLFGFSMLNLVLADNLFQVFVSWELVGICSFGLIGFYYERQTAGLAATKSFIVNRVGDAGFLVGLTIIWSSFGTFNFTELAAKVGAADLPTGLLTLAGLGVFLGCAGKSAQLPLHTWLPDAMEGPTPVSALVHSATMVAAGVYLVARCYFLFTPAALAVIAYTGAATLVVAGLVACVENDIKKVLAYSTISQLGYMMLALGVGGWSAGVLHLLTHAFFKALLFLCAGAVIFNCHHEQDLRKLGGLRRRMPVTAGAMLVGVLALAGTPTFSGWYSKDAVVSAVLASVIYDPTHVVLLAATLLTAGLTAFYAFRLWLMAFAGEPRVRAVYDRAGEAPRVMTVPLVILAAFAYAVALGLPVWDAGASYLGQFVAAAAPAEVMNQFGHALEVAHRRVPAYHTIAGAAALTAAAAGAAFAFAAYGLKFPQPASGEAIRWRRLLANRFYFDEFYDASLVRPLSTLARSCARADRHGIDRAVDAVADGAVRLARGNRRFDVSVLDGAIDGAARRIFSAGLALRGVQTGSLRNYVMYLATAAVGLFAALAYLAARAAG